MAAALALGAAVSAATGVTETVTDTLQPLAFAEDVASNSALSYLQPRMLLSVPCGGSSFETRSIREMLKGHGVPVVEANRTEALFPLKNEHFLANPQRGMAAALDEMVASAQMQQGSLTFKAFTQNLEDCNVVRRLVQHHTLVAAAVRSNLLDYVACLVFGPTRMIPRILLTQCRHTTLHQTLQPSCCSRRPSPSTVPGSPSPSHPQLRYNIPNPCR